MDIHSKTYGYFFVSVTPKGSRRLLPTNNERAFVISQLQDLLSPRMLISAVPDFKQLGSCVDLLAFSVRGEEVQLLLFSIDTSLVAQLISCIATRLSQYRSEQHPTFQSSHEHTIAIKKMRGPHQALAKSIAMHRLHEDWEYDRYSSIGFYLHDRRGDWMRTWRLARLYDNEASHYLQLLGASSVSRTTTQTPIRQSYAA